MRNAVRNQLPGLSKVGRLVNPRVAVVFLMPVDRDIRSACVVTGSLDVADCAPGQHIGDVLSNISPRLAAIAGDLHLAIIGAGPNRAGCLRRFRNRKDDAGVFNSNIVAGQPARESLLAPVVQRQIGTDFLPAVAAVSRLMHVLAADIDFVVIVRRDRQRHSPDKTIFQIGRDLTANVFRPHFYIARLPGFQVEDFDDAADTARAGSARPDDVIVDRIGCGPTALAASDANPGTARNWPTETAAAAATAAATEATASSRPTWAPI